MQQPTSIPTSLSPDQMQRQMVDYDSQVRQGIEDGNIWQVMKQLGPLLVSPIFFPTALTTHTHSGNNIQVSEGYPS